jgi:predicted metalloprotease with PDZ domain
MRKHAFFLCSLFIALATSAQQKLEYRFAVDTTGDKATMTVDLRFRGTDSGRTYLQLPDKWASQSKFYKAVTALKVMEGDAKMTITPDSAVYLLEHKPGAALRVQYKLQQDWKGSLTYPKNYRLVLNKKYLHATGNSLLALPKSDPDDKVEASFDWSGLPLSWSVANSYHSGTRSYSGKMKVISLLEALYVSGDYRLHQTSVNAKPVYLAIRGEGWKFSDTALLKAARDVMSTHRRFWNDHSEPYYLITMTPFAGEGQYNGSALHQSFLMGMAQNFGLDHHLLSLLAHEYFHRWNGLAILMKGDEHENAWFAEGFTEYYTHKLLHRTGLTDLQTYLDRANGLIADYYLSPVRNQERKALGVDFWKKRANQEIPYRKGFTYALYLDHLIGKSSGGKRSLDDLMFAMHKLAKKGKALNDTVFLHLLKKLSGVDMTAEHDRYINKGETIPVLSGSLGPEVRDSLQDIYPFELGFDFDATAERNVITGVVENSAAWHAGLRDGQQWSGGSVYFNNTSMPALVYITEDGKKKEITYKPLGARKERVRVFYKSEERKE